MKYLPIYIVCCMLMACGGGGGGSSATTEPTSNPPTITVSDLDNGTLTVLYDNLDVNNQASVVLNASGTTDDTTALNHITFVWTLDGSQRFNGANPIINLSPGEYSVRLEASDADNNTSALEFTLRVLARGSIPVITPLSLAPISSGNRITIEPSISGLSGSQTIRWTSTSTPAALIGSVNQSSGSVTMTFPFNGSFAVRISIEDLGQTVEESVTIIVNSSDNFAISGSVADDEIATNALAVELLWVPDGGAAAVKTAVSDINGDFSFTELLGKINDFEVLVPESQ